MKAASILSYVFLVAVALAADPTQEKPKAAGNRTLPEGSVPAGTAALLPDQRRKTSTWSYREPGTGPRQWINLDPNYGQCLGRQQSPINIMPKTLELNSKGSMKPLILSYLATETNEGAKWNKPGDAHPEDVMINDGNLIQMYYERGSFLQVHINGERYTVDRLSFHSPSEHKISNKAFPVEMQIIHTSQTGQNLIVSVLFEEGQNSEFLDAFHWNELPMPHLQTKLNSRMNLLDVFGWDMHYWHYMGSLTTPPCNEGVNWYIMQEHPQLSQRQIERLKNALGQDNTRPVQSIGNRRVFSSRQSLNKCFAAQNGVSGSDSDDDVIKPTPCRCLATPKTCPCSPWYKQWVANQDDVVQVTDLKLKDGRLSKTPPGFFKGDMPSLKKSFLVSQKDGTQKSVPPSVTGGVKPLLKEKPKF